MRFAIWLKTLYNTRIKQLNREQNMKVTKFTPKSVGDLENEIVRVLNAAGITGVDFAGNTRSFSRGNETTFKIVAKIEGTQSAADAGLAKYCKDNGIDPNKKGTKGEKIVDYRPRATKHKLVYETVRGARYITDARRWKNWHL